MTGDQLKEAKKRAEAFTPSSGPRLPPHEHRHGQALGRGPGRGPPPPPRPGRPGRRVHRHRVPGGGPCRPGRHRRLGTRALLVGGTGLYLRSVVDDLDIPAPLAEVAADLAAEADQPGGVAALHGRLAALDPVAAARTDPANRRRVLRALEVTVGSGRPFSSFGPGLTAYRRARSSRWGWPRTRPRWTAGSPSGSPAGWTRGSWTRSGPGRPARRPLGTARRPSATASCSPTWRTGGPGYLRGGGGPPHPLLARRQRSWFRRDPRMEWGRARRRPLSVLCARLEGEEAASGGPQ